MNLRDVQSLKSELNLTARSLVRSLNDLPNASGPNNHSSEIKSNTHSTW